MNAVNITVPFLFNGVHYAGLSIHNGVDFELVDVPCSEPDREITLSGCIAVAAKKCKCHCPALSLLCRKNYFPLLARKKVLSRKASS